MEDTNFKWRVKEIIKLQEQGKLVLSWTKEFGLPSYSDLNRKESEVFEEGILVGHIELISGAGVYAFTPIPGAPLPKILRGQKKLRLGEAVINLTKRLAIISTENGETVTINGLFPADPYYAQSELNRALADEGIAVWKVEIIGKDPLFQYGIQRIFNNQTLADLTGYAFDYENSVLVYAGAVGHKTSLQSIHATLIQGKPVSINHKTLYPEAGHWFANTLAIMDYSTWQTAFINHKAVPGKWQPGEYAYALFFEEDQDETDDFAVCFVERLKEVLEIPILEEWGKTLLKAGKDAYLVSELNTWGDCIRAVRIEPSGWKRLVEELLFEEKIKI
ncbi:MAG: hypothetical protein HPY45_09870 [Anaerolineae bacterium]|nr:hypothetical protein [Anaerolineae bacterium]